MALAQDDRIAFSLKIVNADSDAVALDQAKAQLQTQIASVQKLDTANKNLFDPVNVLVNAYQTELTKLDGNVRTTITEQDIQDSAGKKLQNHFFPNDTTVTVPSLASTHNVWTKVKPYANTFAVGKNYIEAFPSSIAGEAGLISTALSLISSASSQTDIQNTSGQHATQQAGTCSLPSYTTQATCVAAAGIWTAGPLTIESFDTVVALKTSLVATINGIVSLLNDELAAIPSDPANSAQNQAAKDNINNIILPALNAWLAYADFQSVPGTVSASSFDSYDSNLLAPTKLHSAQLSALQTSLNSRATFVSNRISQLGTILGGITQDPSSGDVSASSGLYGKRFGFLTLRLNALSGSLMQLINMQVGSGAQDAIKKGTLETKATYQGILPTTLLKAGGNGTSMVNAIDASFLSIGDIVYVMAEGQQELQRAVKAISGTLVTLNDVVPSKYATASKARLYKDIS